MPGKPGERNTVSEKRTGKGKNMEKVLDCKGMTCPLPVITAKKALAEFTEDGVLTVLVDNDIAVQNLTRLGEHNGFAVTSEKKGNAEYAVTMQVKAGANAEQPKEEFVCTVPVKGETVVVISSNQMGTGEETLGKKLIGAFIFALTSQDKAPDKMIFYNTGAFLTTEGSASIKDLKALEESGTTIMTCGTCLDYYGIKDKLQVGIISNMYDIVEAQINAGLIIRP